MTSDDPVDIPLGVGGAVLARLYGHVLLLTLNRPEARNAVNVDVARGIGGALDRADGDPAIRAVILTGAGGRSFCAGQDLKEAAAGIAFDSPDADRWGFAGYVHHAIAVPTIAAVNGFALGGGTELVLASDLAVAAETAVFGLPEVTRGIVAGAGGAFRLPRQIPPKLAMEAMLTGQPISAGRAYEVGLVNRVVSAEAVLDEAFRLADAIIRNAPAAVQASKRIALGIDGGRTAAEYEDWVRTAREGAQVLATEDAREGMAAFAEKRAPQWQGR